MATSTVEIGNVDLQEETANNFDIGLRYRKDNWRFNVAAFYNKINDFIFLNPNGDEVEGLPVFIYDQQNAVFKGFEGGCFIFFSRWL